MVVTTIVVTATMKDATIADVLDITFIHLDLDLDLDACNGWVHVPILLQVGTAS